MAAPCCRRTDETTEAKSSDEASTLQLLSPVLPTALFSSCGKRSTRHRGAVTYIGVEMFATSAATKPTTTTTARRIKYERHGNAEGILCCEEAKKYYTIHTHLERNGSAVTRTLMCPIIIVFFGIMIWRSWKKQGLWRWWWAIVPF